MKFKKLGRTILSVLVVVSMLASIPVFAEEPEGKQQYTITEPYEYPVIPGTPEWVALENRREACQIPNNILSEMSTEALIQSCLEYPFIVDIYAFNTLEQGFRSVSSTFNGFSELQIRSDASTLLLEEYKNTPIVSELSRASEDEKFETANRLTYLETILSSDNYQKMLDETEKTSFENDVYQKYEARLENKNYYFFLSPYYEKLLADQGVQLMDYSTTIKTPKGSTVDVEVRTEMTSSQISDINSHYDSLYPTAIRKSSASNRYNCHNYAWNKKSTGYWMDNPYKYMSDKSYTKIPGSSQNGNIMYMISGGDRDTESYPGTTHSGIKSGTKMISKWGVAGVYESYITGSDGSPYNDYAIEYYR